MIGKRLGEQLSVRAGDSVTLVAARGAVTPMGTTPRIKAYKIAAIFDVGMSEDRFNFCVHATARIAG